MSIADSLAYYVPDILRIAHPVSELISPYNEER